ATDPAFSGADHCIAAVVFPRVRVAHSFRLSSSCFRWFSEHHPVPRLIIGICCGGQPQVRQLPETMGTTSGKGMSTIGVPNLMRFTRPPDSPRCGRRARHRTSTAALLLPVPVLVHRAHLLPAESPVRMPAMPPSPHSLPRRGLPDD